MNNCISSNSLEINDKSIEVNGDQLNRVGNHSDHKKSLQNQWDSLKTNENQPETKGNH